MPLQEYYWWIKYWQFYAKIANCQSLLLANISFYTVSYSPWDITIAYLISQMISLYFAKHYGNLLPGLI